MRRLLMLSAAVLLTGCAASGSSSSGPSGPSIVVRNELALERAITGEANTYIRSMFTARQRFAVNTQCNPTTPDDFDWTCSTAPQISNPAVDTSACTVRTSVTTSGGKFRWTGLGAIAAASLASCR